MTIHLALDCLLFSPCLYLLAHAYSNRVLQERMPYLPTAPMQAPTTIHYILLLLQTLFSLSLPLLFLFLPFLSVV